MKSKILYIIIFTLLSRFGYSQTYFNHSYNFELPNVIFTNILIEQDTICLTGPVTDIISPAFNSAISKFNLSGNMISFNVFKTEESELSLWRKNLIKKEELYYSAGTIIDSIDKAGILIHDDKGNIDTLLKFANPNHPEQSFCIPNFLTFDQYDNLIFAYKYNNLNNRSTVKIVKLKNLIESSSILIENLFSTELTHIKSNSSHYFFGYSNHNINFTQKDFIFQNVIQKRDTSLNLIWEYKTPLYKLLGVVGAIATTKDNGIVVSTMEGREVFVNPNVNTYDVKNIIFYKLNNQGQKVWETEFIRNPSHSSKFISNMKELPNGDIIASGQVFEGESEKGTLIKLSSEGDSLWQRFYSYPDKYGHSVHDMEILPDGSIILAGENNAPQEGWLLAVDSMGCLIPNCVTSTNEEFFTDSPLIRIYPNPAANNLNVQFKSVNNMSNGVFRIFSNSGQLMKEWNNSHHDHFIILDVHDYPSGQYFLQYEFEGNLINEPFVKS